MRSEVRVLRRRIGGGATAVVVVVVVEPWGGVAVVGQ
jgi:hypothetical protein